MMKSPVTNRDGGRVAPNGWAKITSQYNLQTFIATLNTGVEAAACPRPSNQPMPGKLPIGEPEDPEIIARKAAQPRKVKTTSYNAYRATRGGPGDWMAVIVRWQD